MHFASPYWANSLLSNMLYTIRPSGTTDSKGPGYIKRTPEIRIWDGSAQGAAITVDNAYLKAEVAQGAYATGYQAEYNSGYAAVPVTTTAAYTGYEPKVPGIATEEIGVQYRY